MELRPFRRQRTDADPDPETGPISTAPGDQDVSGGPDPSPGADERNGDAPAAEAASPAAETATGEGESPATEGESPAPAADAPATAAVPAGAVAPAPVVVPRWVQLVLLPLALLGLWELAKAAGTIFLVLIAASVIAMILNPMTKRFQRFIPRGLAIVASYLVVVVLFAAVVAALSAPVTKQVSHFASNLPYYTNKANHELSTIQSWLNSHGLHIHIQKQGSTALQSLERRLSQSSGSILSVSRDVVGKVVSIGLDLILTFVLSVYLLVYAGEIGDLVRRVVPRGDGTARDDYPLLMQRAVSGYVRGQLLFSLTMGASAALALWVLGVTHVFSDGSRYAIFFGLFYGLMELIPYIGPIIGPIPAVLVALFTNPISALWVVLMFIGLQQLEGHVVAPQIFRISLRINPILVILALLLGYQLYGIAGALVALPVATIIRQTILYLKRHLVLEQWSTQAPPL